MLIRSVLLSASLASVTIAASAAERPAASDLWQIELGTPASEIPDSFAEFACGSNGGPPGQPLSGFGDFMDCAVGADGLHEVYFRYDDELEYWARANNMPLLVAQAGTKVYDLPVIASVLIDDDGVVRGIRLVSDPRDTSVRRSEARFLHPFLKARFESSGARWDCTEIPLSGRESPVNGEVMKEDCTMVADGVRYDLSVRYFRRQGQRQVDRTGQFTIDEFTSEVRFTMHQR